MTNTAYFVYCNGLTNTERFDKQLKFDISLIPYIGNTDWVFGAVCDAYQCLQSDNIPLYSDDCDFCQYTIASEKVLHNCF